MKGILSESISKLDNSLEGLLVYIIYNNIIVIIILNINVDDQ